MVRSCPAYDRPTIETINSLRNRLGVGRLSYTQPVAEQIRRYTESTYYGILTAWQSRRCYHPLLRRQVCQEQDLKLYAVNTVSIC